MNDLNMYENGTDEQINSTIHNAIKQNKKAFIAWLCQETFYSQLIGEVPENQFVVEFEQDGNAYEFGMMLKGNELKYSYIMPFTKQSNGAYATTYIYYPKKDAVKFYDTIFNQFMNWFATKPNIDRVISEYHNFYEEDDDD